MVNLILVSHSKKLADGVAEMVQQMTSSNLVKIATAAGIGDQNHELGTNAVEIAEAMENLYTDAGILVLMDLGSAILSTEMALDIIPSEMKSKIKICPAPFVEGAIAAGVQANMGSDLETVYQEAVNALKAKREQLGEQNNELPDVEPAVETPLPSDSQTREVVLTIENAQGLHARPAVLFVKTISSFDATVKVKNLTENKGPVITRGLTSVMLLGARKGHQIHVSAEGPQRNEVIDALIDLVDKNFGESPE